MIQPRKFARLPKGAIKKPLGEVLTRYVGRKKQVITVMDDGIKSETFVLKQK